MTKAVLMVGGGGQQVDAVRVARSAGYRVVVSDRNADAPAFAEADEAWVVDGRDAAELGRRARAAAANGLAAVFTLTELVETVAEVARAAGLPGVAPEAARACQDKALAKELWTRAGVATPRGGPARDADGARRLFRELGGRAFVKPARSFGGRRSGAARDERRLVALFEQAASDGGAVVVEELLEGTHHDANGVFDASGRFHAAGVADRAFADRAPVELEASAPASLDADEERTLLDLVERAARALGIGLGPVKADLVRTRDGFRILEMAPRLHGPRGTLGLLPAARGFQPLVGALRVLAGDPLADELRPTRAGAAVYGALAADPGVVTGIAGVDEALSMPGAERVWLFVSPGARVASPSDSTGVPGYVLAAGADRDEARARMRAARALIRITTRG